MSQKNIGEFMLQLRKRQNMTQKELADRIGVSDKTISKWENGNSIPDTSILLSLCQALDVSVNELLSCEKLPPEDYSKKAEENMMSLLKENETTKKSNRTSLIIGCILIVLAFIFLYLSLFGANLSAVGYFIDFPSILELVLVCIAGLFLSGVKGKTKVLAMLQKIIIPTGALLFLISVLVILLNMEDISTLGPALWVALIPMLYALLIYVILLPINKRLES